MLSGAFTAQTLWRGRSGWSCGNIQLSQMSRSVQRYTGWPPSRAPDCLSPGRPKLAAGQQEFISVDGLAQKNTLRDSAAFVIRATGRIDDGDFGMLRSDCFRDGVVMSGCRPLIKGYFGVALVVDAVMSSAFLRGEFESAGPDVVR